MASTLSFNPMQTSNAAGFFNTSSDGYHQGMAMADPATRFALAGGQLAAAETLPIWGGIAISESIPLATGAGSDLGEGSIARATAYTNITGFTCIDQSANFIVVPGSNSAPSGSAGMSVQFYRMGSGARLALQIDPALVSLDGGLITQQVSYDFTNGKIIAFATTALPVKILQINTNSRIIAYNGTTGAVTWTNGACALVQL